MDYHIEIYKRAGILKRWGWRRIAGNGKVTETPGQGFVSKWNAKRSAKKAHPTDRIEETS